MKKLITLILASLMLISVMAGCGTTVPNATESTSATEETKEETTYSDSLESLADYMKDQGYIADTENAYEMQAQLIGAEKGYRYLNGGVQIELYSYNPDKLNKTAKDIINQIEKNNEFELYGKKIKGYLSDNGGKYMMVYTDSAIADGDTTSDAYKTMENAVEDLNKFVRKYSVTLLDDKDTEKTKNSDKTKKDKAE